MMMMFVTWIGWTVVVLVVACVFAGAQNLVGQIVIGDSFQSDWAELCIVDCVMAMVAWLPFSLGWFITAAQKTAEVIAGCAA